MWYKTNGSISSTSDAPTEIIGVSMQWQKYDRVGWSASGFDDDHPRTNQFTGHILKPINAPTVGFHQDHETTEAELIHYELNATEFNPTAELVRAYEFILHKSKNDGVRPDLDLLLSFSSFEWHETRQEPVLSDTKQFHNMRHALIQQYTAKWANHWGKPNDDSYEYKERNYLRLAHMFHNIYISADDKGIIDKGHYKEINQNIRLNCEVGLHEDGLDNIIGIIPKSLLGFLWLNLAEDIANKKSYGICSRPGCIRVFGTNVRSDKSACSSECRNYLNRNPDAKEDHDFTSMFESREV